MRRTFLNNTWNWITVLTPVFLKVTRLEVLPAVLLQTQDLWEVKLCLWA
jgi:hypothetical protein